MINVNVSKHRKLSMSISDTATLNLLKEVVPNEVSRWVSKELLTDIDKTEENSFKANAIKENLTNFAGILSDSRYRKSEATVANYFKATQFCTYKLMGESSVTAFTKTFPKEYAKAITDRVSIEKLARVFESTPMCRSIMEYSMLPNWLLYAEVYADAINTQARLMRTAESEKVRCDAANSLLTHLGRPKEFKPTELTTQDASAIASDLSMLKQAMMDLANMQQAKIINGESTKTIAEGTIVSKTYDK